MKTSDLKVWARTLKKGDKVLCKYGEFSPHIATVDYIEPSAYTSTGVGVMLFEVGKLLDLSWIQPIDEP